MLLHLGTEDNVFLQKATWLQLDFLLVLIEGGKTQEVVNTGQIFKGTECICDYLIHATFYQSKHSRKIYYTFLVHILKPTKTPDKNMQSCSLILSEVKDNRASNRATTEIFRAFACQHLC